MPYPTYIKVINVGCLNYVYTYVNTTVYPYKDNIVHDTAYKKSCTGCPDSGLVAGVICTESYVVSW